MLVNVTDKSLIFKGSDESAGIDIILSDTFVILPFQTKVIDLKIGIEIPKGHFGLLTPRSSTKVKKKLDITTGVIDSDYRGSVCCVVTNNSILPKKILKGERLVQMIFLSCSGRLYEGIKIQEIKHSDFSKTKRNTGGFGSSGR